jgi:VanZ family protein
MKKLTEKRWFWPALALVWIAVIFLHSLQPADVSAEESSRVLALLRKIVPGISELFVRKAAHFCEFFVLGCLLFMTVRSELQQGLFAAAAWGEATKNRLPWLMPSAGGLLCAVCDEGIQLGVEGRSGEWKDVLLDFAGVCCAVLICRLLSQLLHRKHVEAAD